MENCIDDVGVPGSGEGVVVRGVLLQGGIAGLLVVSTLTEKHAK